jgi:hypothetical protein
MIIYCKKNSQLKIQTTRNDGTYLLNCVITRKIGIYNNKMWVNFSFLYISNTQLVKKTLFISMGRRTILVDVWKGEQFSLCYGKKNISHCYGKKNNNSCCFGKENMTSLFLFYGKMNYYEKKKYQSCRCHVVRYFL